MLIYKGLPCRQSDADFAGVLLQGSNCVERCKLGRSFKFHAWNKGAQLDQIHRVMHHRPHQAEY